MIYEYNTYGYYIDYSYQYYTMVVIKANDINDICCIADFLDKKSNALYECYDVFYRDGAEAGHIKIRNLDYSRRHDAKDLLEVNMIKWFEGC